MSGEPSWNKADLDFDERGRLIIRNRALANRILDAHNSNQGLRIVHEQHSRLEKNAAELGPELQAQRALAFCLEIGHVHEQGIGR